MTLVAGGAGCAASGLKSYDAVAEAPAKGVFKASYPISHVWGHSDTTFDTDGSEKAYLSVIVLVAKEHFLRFAENPYSGGIFHFSSATASKFSGVVCKQGVTFLSCSKTAQEPLRIFYKLFYSINLGSLFCGESSPLASESELHLVDSERPLAFDVEVIDREGGSKLKRGVDQVVAVMWDEPTCTGGGDCLKLQRLDPFSKLLSTASKVSDFMAYLCTSGFFGEDEVSSDKIFACEKAVTEALSCVSDAVETANCFAQSIGSLSNPYQLLYAKRVVPMPALAPKQSYDVAYLLNAEKGGSQLDFVVENPLQLGGGSYKTLRKGVSFVGRRYFGLLRLDYHFPDMEYQEWKKIATSEIVKIARVERLNQGKMPYVLRYYGFYEQLSKGEKDYTLVTDYYPSRSAYHFFISTDHSTRPKDLRDKGTLTKLAIGVIIQQLQALAWLHAQGLAHQDINPNNILVAWEGESLVSALADFGAIKPLDKCLKDRDDIRTTYEFLAPEYYWNLKDEINSLIALDSWSFGITALCLVTGMLPPWRTRGDDEKRYAAINHFFSDPVQMKTVLDLWIPEGAIGDYIRPFLELDPLKRATPASMIKMWETLS